MTGMRVILWYLLRNLQKSYKVGLTVCGWDNLNSICTKLLVKTFKQILRKIGALDNVICAFRVCILSLQVFRKHRSLAEF